MENLDPPSPKIKVRFSLHAASSLIFLGGGGGGFVGGCCFVLFCPRLEFLSS